MLYVYQQIRKILQCQNDLPLALCLCCILHILSSYAVNLSRLSSHSFPVPPSSPPVHPPLTVRSSSPLFSPRGSYITSTQLIFSKIINELLCVYVSLCVSESQEKIEWSCGLQPASVKYLLQHINVCVCVIVCVPLPSVGSTQGLYSWQTVTVEAVWSTHIFFNYSSVLRGGCQSSRSSHWSCTVMFVRLCWCIPDV